MTERLSHLHGVRADRCGGSVEHGVYEGLQLSRRLRIMLNLPASLEEVGLLSSAKLYLGRMVKACLPA